MQSVYTILYGAVWHRDNTCEKVDLQANSIEIITYLHCYVLKHAEFINSSLLFSKYIFFKRLIMKYIKEQNCMHDINIDHNFECSLHTLYFKL